MPYLNHIPSQPEPVDCRILTAALDLFVVKGYHNVSVHDLQREANVSIGSIYNHFGGKEGIAKALYNHLLKEMEEMVDDAVEQHDDARHRSSAIIRKLFEYTESHTNIISYVFHAKHTEFISDEQPICNSLPFTKMRNIIQQGMDNGELRKTDPWVAASIVFGAAIRMIHLRLDGIIKEPVTQYTDEILESAWLSMKPEKSPSSSRKISA